MSVVRLILATRRSGPPASQLSSEWDTLYKFVYVFVLVSDYVPLTKHHSTNVFGRIKVRIHEIGNSTAVG